MGMDEAVAALSDELMEQMRAAARMLTETAAVSLGEEVSTSDLDQDSYEVGVQAGMAAAVMVLQQRGVIPGG